MMNLNILETVPHYCAKYPWALGCAVILCIVGVVLCITGGIVYNLIYDDAPAIILFICSIILVIISIASIGLGTIEDENKVDYYTYEVYVQSESEAKDIYDNYEIIHNNYPIFEIKEKNNIQR